MQFTDLDDASRALLERVMEQRERAASPPRSVAPRLDRIADPVACAAAGHPRGRPAPRPRR